MVQTAESSIELLTSLASSKCIYGSKRISGRYQSMNGDDESNTRGGHEVSGGLIFHKTKK